MNVNTFVLITKTLTKGGAASGARNLLGALRAAGAEVTVLDAYAQMQLHPIRAVRVAERVVERLAQDAETHFLRLGPPTFDLRAVYRQYKPDVIQLCDISANTIRFSDIAHLPCPVVHRMSDFWPYNGAHHYAETPPRQPDLADRMLRRLVFDGRSMPHRRVAPSDWLASRLGGPDISVIRNAVAVPTHVDPRSSVEGVVRFGFISGQIMDPRKGYAALPSLLNALAGRVDKRVQLHVFGRNANGNLAQIPGVETIHHPAFSSSDLARVYTSFDILLCPSRLDNSPNVVTEALAHGTPVIGQKGTGMESYIRQDIGGLIDFHRLNGPAVEEFSGVVQAISRNYEQISMQAMRYTRDELSPPVIGKLYLDLYEELLMKGVK
ncbi:glycosyltransferase [Roseinatronobacter alkalisoli]|uniref:Glycosyltransferase n=1 Tax=Roseinatronobacter alkalisoli TaxID=3028235 RepID=A0ABT5TA35_9RHOB|nr:glycosyltransferase [Roseinatronobacter sp. HJB301]MDD7971983.1 glycosyltransferase [Roseinatronobacter sp. HJB301]